MAKADAFEKHVVDSGFYGFQFVEPLFHPLAEIVKTEPVQEGYGEGAFVVIKALKRKHIPHIKR